MIMRKCMLTTCYKRNCIQDKCSQIKYYLSDNDDYTLIGITNPKYFEICNRHNVCSVPGQEKLRKEQMVY